MLFDNLPKNELEFHERFSTEEACRDYLSSVRWPEGFVCPHCGHKGGTLRKGREEWLCDNRTCGKETSLRSGTVFHKSRKPLRAWLLVIYLMTTNKQGISALRVQRLLQLGSYHTALRWTRELRRCMGVALAQRDPLGPEVEMDETSIGRRDEGGKRGKGSETKAHIIGAVERLTGGCGRARLKYIPQVNGDVIAKFLNGCVQKGAILHTDQLPSYDSLADLGFFVDSRVVKSTAKEKQKVIEEKKAGQKAEHKVMVHLPRIHRVFSLVKRVNICTHQGSFSEKHLQSYLDEYCFRFEGRNRVGFFHLVHELVTSAFLMKAVPYWQSCGRTAPRESTFNQSRQWIDLGEALGQLST